MSDYLLQQAKDAILSWDRTEARTILGQLIKQEPRNVEAWLLLAEAVETKEQAIYCMEHTLKIDPRNPTARKWLGVLKPEETPKPKPSLSKTPATTPTPKSTAAVKPIQPPTKEPSAPIKQPKPGGRLKLEALPTAGPASAPALTRTPRYEPPASPPEREPSVVEEPHPLPTQLYKIKEPTKEDLDLERLRPHKPFNWPLIVGLVSLLTITFLAIAGPSIAPRDPLEENLIIQVEGEWFIPPYKPFTQGFPMGSDMFGRDNFSRILWAVRPTVIMVVIVAFVRLVIGSLIGLLAGWTSGRVARSLDTLIDAAIAIPTLLVALGAIAVIGVEFGIWAFIIGLSITGWVESAQQIREQTRIVKGQEYIEAAFAMGASKSQILFKHILKQIAPMTVMLFAFEMSSTLMTTAGLGFLGYYIGGDVWVDVDDFVARRISGMPELGQMLATSWSSLTQSWGMVAVGSTVFLAVLGLNLLGEGFRQRLNLFQVRRRGIAAKISEKLSFWLDQYLLYPFSLAFDKPAVRVAFSGTLLIILVGTAGKGLWPQVQPLLEASPPQVSLVTSDDTASSTPQTAASENELAPSVEVVTYTPVIAWEFEDPSGFAGGPIVSLDGKILYVASEGGTLYALSPEGDIFWQTELLTDTVGTPALDANGNIYITDRQAGLYAVTPIGEVSWYFQSQAGIKAISGPVIASDGTIYYTVTPGGQGFVQAVSATGENLWTGLAATPSFYRTPEPSPDEQLVFLKNDIFDALTGELKAVEVEADLDVFRYFSGEDGRTYLQAGNNIIQWQLNGNVIEIADTADWSAPEQTYYGHTVVPDSGVTSDRRAWMLYTTPGGRTDILWLSMDNEFLGSAHHLFSQSQMVAIQEDLTTYVCGGKPFIEEFAECAAFKPGTEDPIWKVNLGRHGLVEGGLWTDEHLFVTTQGGKLYAIEVTQGVQVAETPTKTPPPQAATPDEPGVVWSYQVPEKVKDMRSSADGSVYALSTKNVFYIIEPDGTLRNSIEITPSPYVLMNNWGGTGPTIWPTVTADGTIIVVSKENTVYGLDAEGKTLWEVPLEEDPSSPPPRTDNGDLYLVDTKGGLYAFGSEGLRWHFQSEAAPYTAADLVLGPGGVLFYTVTNRTQTYIEALSLEGKHLWTAQVRTLDIYDPVQVSIDGDLVFLKDNAFDARTGNILGIDESVNVDEFVPGFDGNTYLRSGHTVMQLQLGEGRFEVLQTEPWEHDAFENFDPRGSAVDKNQIIWLFYEASFSAGYGVQLVWVTLDGQVLESHFWTWGSRRMTSPDYSNSRIFECSYLEQEEQLVCEAYAPESHTPIWNVTIDDVPDIDSGFIVDGYVYLLTKDDEVVMVYTGEPEE